MTHEKTIAAACSLLFVAACATLGGTGRSGPAPPFEWDSAYADSGVSLELQELGRRPGTEQTGTLVRYRLQTTGFAAGDDYVLWRRIAGAYEPMPASVDAEGVVVLLGSETFTTGILVRGEPLDLALASETSGARAHAKTIPFSIEAMSPAGCALAAEVLARTGLAFLMTLRGFDPGTVVTTIGEFADDRFELVDTIPPTGVARQVISFNPGSDGTATVSARGGGCEVSLEYAVGPDAMEAQ